MTFITPILFLPFAIKIKTQNDKIMSTTKHDPKEFLNAFSAKVSAYLMTLPKNQIYEEVNELETEKLSRLMKQSEINENFEICSAIQKVINERMKDIFEKKEV